MSRADRAAEAVRLRGEGLTFREIAGRMGVSRSYADALLNDPDRVKDLARRAGYGGRCEVCGKRTDGSNGQRGAPDRCVRHPRLHITWTEERVVAAIRGFADRHGHPPAAMDFNYWGCRHKLGDEERARRVQQEYIDGLIPCFTTVVNAFGSWNAGVVAAGFTPRPPGRPVGQRARGRGARYLADRQVAAAAKLVGAGVPVAEIARRGWRRWGYASEASAYGALREALAKGGYITPVDREVAA